MLLLTDLRIIGVRIAKGIKVDLVNLKNKDNLINLLTRIISLIELSSDIDKIEILLVLFIYLFIFYIHMRPDLSYDGWPRTIPKEARVGPMFFLAT